MQGGSVMRKKVLEIFGIIGIILIIFNVLIVVDVIYFGYMEIPYELDALRTERIFREIYGIRDGDLIDFQFYGRHEIDMSRLREYSNVVDGTPFTDFSQIRCIEEWEANYPYGERYVVFPDIEPDVFQSGYVVISYGREIVEMRRNGRIHFEEFPVSVTFSEEHYGDVMFVYLMDEVPFRLGVGRGYYIMEGSERVYIGHGGNLNERNP
jgi:hypothetical protein